MSEVFFYHLERQPLEVILPHLLERTLERQWRAVVEAPSKERLEALDSLLWTYRDDSFLPHGAEGDSFAADQPIVLTTTQSCPNQAHIRFLVDGSPPSEIERYDRVAVLFDGRDEEAVVLAREQWKALRASAHTLAYWQQEAEGRWAKKA